MRNPRFAVYIISVAAELAGVHPQTLRIYERKGLLRPQRTSEQPAPLQRAGHRAAARDPGVDGAGRQPGGREADHGAAAGAGRDATADGAAARATRASVAPSRCPAIAWDWRSSRSSACRASPGGTTPHDRRPPSPVAGLRGRDARARAGRRGRHDGPARPRAGARTRSAPASASAWRTRGSSMPARSCWASRPTAGWWARSRRRCPESAIAPGRVRAGDRPVRRRRIAATASARRPWR